MLGVLITEPSTVLMPTEPLESEAKLFLSVVDSEFDSCKLVDLSFLLLDISSSIGGVLSDIRAVNSIVSEDIINISELIRLAIKEFICKDGV